MRKRILALTLALSLLLTACGGGTSAATMHLRKTEGTVGVSDGDGKDITPRDDLGLYSGYGVDTSSESYAWIDLDEVKLTKLDQDSEIAIMKEGKHLEIEVKSGSLFFNITEPLADDESMNIRTSTMIIGIRGTCGWVTQDTAALLEGTVEVTAEEQAVTISAGEMAVMTADGMLEVVAFSDQDIPGFVLTEVGEEPPKTDESTDGANENVDKIALLQDMNYLGDPAACQMTATQAEAFVRNIESSMDSSGGRAYGCLFDSGNGIPGMLLATGEDLDLSADPQGHGNIGVFFCVNDSVEYMPMGFSLGGSKAASITIYPRSYMRLDEFSEPGEYTHTSFYAFGSDGFQDPLFRSALTIEFWKSSGNDETTYHIYQEGSSQTVSEDVYEAQLSEWENMPASTGSGFQTASAAWMFDTRELFMLENLTPNLLDALRTFAAQ